jgi:hypothetical protein
VPSSHQCGNRRAFWQVCFSVLLIGLVLYNPFLALGNQADGLSYQALARHRATVGASEMQHFTPMQGVNAQLEATVEQIFTEFLVENHASLFHIFQEERLPQRPEPMGSIWFRPPPSR